MRARARARAKARARVKEREHAQKTEKGRERAQVRYVKKEGWDPGWHDWVLADMLPDMALVVLANMDDA